MHNPLRSKVLLTGNTIMGNSLRQTRYNRQPVPRGNLVYESFLSGNSLDLSGQGNNGTDTDITYVATAIGYHAQQADFNGTSSYIDIPTTTVDIAGDFSVSAWVYKEDGASSGTDNDRIYDFVDNSTTDYFQLITDDGNQKFAAKLVRSTTAHINLLYSSFVLNAWQHVAYSISGTTGSFYYNGQLVAGSGSPSIGAGGTTYSIGRRGDGVASTFFTGQMIFPRIYSRSISQQEAYALYLEGLSFL